MGPEPPSRKAGSYAATAAVTLLLAVFFVRELYYVSYSSPTFDEAQYTAYGFSLLKTGDFRLANYKPDLVPLLSALPLLATRARLDTSDPHWKNAGASSDDLWQATLDFLHHNVLPADELLFYARLPIIFLALMLGLAVYDWSSRLYGRAAGLLSLLLFTTGPNMLAYGGLVTEDMAFTALSFLAVYAWYLYNREGGKAALAASGLFLGLALNAKYTAVLLLPSLAAYLLLELRLRRAAVPEVRSGLAALGTVFGLAALTLLAFYGFTHAGHYLGGLLETRSHINGGQMSYLNGRYSPTGFWDYFLYALLVKTPLPVLLLALLAAAVRIKEKSLLSRDGLYLAFFPALLLVSASFSNFNIGLRHVLPVYPFLFVFCGGALKLFKKKLSFIVPALLLLWQIKASAGVQPYFLTYFNELAGGPARGDEHLLDSNLDWGQDLKGLGRYLDREKVSDLILSYYGSTLPDYIGRPYQDLFSTIEPRSRHLDGLHPAREYLAVSATNLHGLYYKEFGKDIFYWLRGRKPKAVIGNNIRVYDVTSDAGAHEGLASVYFLAGYPARAVRECERALLLDPASRRTEFLLALVLLKTPATQKEGLKELREYLRVRGREVPAGLFNFMPSPFFRYRYYLAAGYAAEKLRGAGDPADADFMLRLGDLIKEEGARARAEAARRRTRPFL